MCSVDPFVTDSFHSVACPRAAYVKNGISFCFMVKYYSSCVHMCGGVLVLCMHVCVHVVMDYSRQHKLIEIDINTQIGKQINTQIYIVAQKNNVRLLVDTEVVSRWLELTLNIHTTRTKTS